MISPKVDLSKTDAEDIAKSIREGMIGPDKAGAMVLVNKAMEVTKWTQTNTDAQFIEGREFSVSEVARMLGIPTHMLYSMSKDQSFASGLAEQVAGWQKSTLMPLTSRIEQALSGLLVKPKYVEFDYKGLLQPVPEVEIKLILQQLDAGIMSEEEARELLGLGQKESGDTFRTPAPVPPSGKLPLEPVPASGGGNTNGKTPAGMGA
jgi:HK97 family phage portal protein